MAPVRPKPAPDRAARRETQLAQAFDPNSEEALFATASLHYGRRELDQAQRLCDRVIGGNARHAGALYLSGRIALTQGRLPAAKEWFARAAAAGPETKMLLDIADVLEQADDLAGALHYCRHALLIAPFDPRARYRVGMLLLWTGDGAGAVASLREALSLDPALNEARIDLGRALLATGQYREAQQALQPVLDLQPPSVSALVFHGLACHELGEFPAAIESLGRALKLERNPAYTLCNLANAYRDAGDFDRASEHYERAMALAPDNMETRNDYAHGLLATGRFERGWALYEARWGAAMRKDHALYAQPLWNGEPLAGKRLLVWTEQGIGDEILFAGLFGELQALGASCTVVSEPRLARLIERSFPGMRVVARKSEAHAALLKESFDYQVPVGSLGRHFRRGPADFPRHSGYLRADSVRAEAWRTRLATLGAGGKIGISWRGGHLATRRHLRSIDLEAWLPILRTPGLVFVSLQYGDCAAEIAALRDTHGVVLHHWQEAIDDCDETAALVCALDQVVSVCTSVAHLAGALGRPVRVLVPAVPEWRYGREGDGMPWYPSARLYRQPRVGEWGGVVERVAGELRGL